MKQKVSEECKGARSLSGIVAGKKEKENWYLPYMDKKTKGVEVEERKSPVAVFYCAGASNVGQATVAGSVRAADELGYEKAALLCLASISAGLANITKAAREAKGIVAIDGCPMHCALKTLNKADFAVDRHMTLSKDLEIPKNFNLNSATDAAKIAKAVEQEIIEVYNK